MESSNWQKLKPVFDYQKDFIDYSSPWLGHIYFSYDLAMNLKPKVIVELGTHMGISFYSFCQAIKDSGLSTSLNAIDTWEGDPHAGFYGNAVYELVNKLIGLHYNKLNINLIRKTFDEARSDFKDIKINLLHIDGFHTYDAVKHDYETWKSFLDEDSVVLFHDVAVKDYGVKDYWEELKLSESEFFYMEFDHSNGLGVMVRSTKIKEMLNKESIRDLKNHYESLFRDFVSQGK